MPTETDRTEIAVRLRNVLVRFDRTELRFDCALPKGQIIAITGASGSGKSTLLNVIAGFENPDAGRVEILGEDAAGRDPAERPVSVIFQEHNLFSHLDVATNIGLGIDPALKLGVKERARIAAALGRVGLDGFAKRMPPTLSGGERQRVALARALVRKKPILLLDEPFAALDPGLRAGMSSLLLDLHRQEGNTMLIITHHPDDVRALADSVLFLDEGRILLHEPTENFLTHRDIPAVERFLGR
ncbi:MULTISPECIES: ATP-binding cassette domain-containing protein [unclassified Rhizobium]|uniref:thiamine ABC transporter ATP-binding protein n=1 Tax=unclassified Rhizobium TaxID=2613769 RepID=UPI0007149E0A|nr:MULTISPECIES: ATP-binding cassette domain-containing protein [unclassified Rhizobium]KQS83865.1 thiamine ABC transporter ATP-binding protein [Rhizobium sp. Leaf386]KQT05005.1 thiamine ABC transporter ATP-binding protein [Rhizobium sp. Leaf391]KQU08806.1 thiamine ABC transporter ATP-binding protein [Rhizobium sp. Leaf453]